MQVFMNTSCTRRATSRSGQAETMVVGRSMATSSAWVGPERATSGTSGAPCRRSSSRITWVIVNSVSGSMPFATSTRIWPSRIWGAAERAVPRT